MTSASSYAASSPHSESQEGWPCRLRARLQQGCWPLVATAGDGTCAATGAAREDTSVCARVHWWRLGGRTGWQLYMGRRAFFCWGCRLSITVHGPRCPTSTSRPTSHPAKFQAGALLYRTTAPHARTHAHLHPPTHLHQLAVCLGLDEAVHVRVVHVVPHALQEGVQNQYSYYVNRGYGRGVRVGLGLEGTL